MSRLFASSAGSDPSKNITINTIVQSSAFLIMTGAISLKILYEVREQILRETYFHWKFRGKDVSIADIDNEDLRATLDPETTSVAAQSELVNIVDDFGLSRSGGGGDEAAKKVSPRKKITTAPQKKLLEELKKRGLPARKIREIMRQNASNADIFTTVAVGSLGLFLGTFLVSIVTSFTLYAIEKKQMNTQLVQKILITGALVASVSVVALVAFAVGAKPITKTSMVIYAGLTALFTIGANSFFDQLLLPHPNAVPSDQ